MLWTGCSQTSWQQHEVALVLMLLAGLLMAAADGCALHVAGWAGAYILGPQCGHLR
jgi:hypothetical protein